MRETYGAPIIMVILLLVAAEALITCVWIYRQADPGAVLVAPVGIALIRFAIALGLAGVIWAIRDHSRQAHDDLDERLGQVERWAGKISRNTAKDED